MFWRCEPRSRRFDEKGADSRCARFVGGEESGQLLHMLAEGGQHMTFGAMANRPIIVSPGALIFKQATIKFNQATIKGFWAAKLGRAPPGRNSPRDWRPRPSRGHRRAETDHRKGLPFGGSRQARAPAWNRGEQGRSRFGRESAHRMRACVAHTRVICGEAFLRLADAGLLDVEALRADGLDNAPSACDLRAGACGGDRCRHAQIRRRSR